MTTREFSSEAGLASYTLLTELQKAYRENPKPTGWALGVMTQGFRIPRDIAEQVLKGERECQVKDRRFVIQMD